MTLNQLTYFYHAATLQHFNQAAEKANISEPSLSRSIAALEAEFNVILFEKKGRNVQLTKAGNVLLKHATYILNEVQATENKMHQIATDGGHIDIAYVSPLARNYVPRTVRAFLSKSQNKNVIFNFHQDITSKNVEGLKLGNYDLIFGSYAENNWLLTKFVLLTLVILNLFRLSSRRWLSSFRKIILLHISRLSHLRFSGNTLSWAMTEVPDLENTHILFLISIISFRNSSVNRLMKTELPRWWQRGLALRLSPMLKVSTGMILSSNLSFLLKHFPTPYIWDI